MRLLCLLFLVLSGNTLAADFPSAASIYLVDAQQDEFRVGSVTYTDTEDGKTLVKLEMDTDQFTDHFLSMRPFRCIEGETEWFCYLQYPYELRSIITASDLSDLEYQLLFILKQPSEFGIDAWNGLYYALEVEADGSISGKLMEGDLNVLQVPPSEKYAKPIDLSEFIPADTSRRLYPTLRIY